MNLLVIGNGGREHAIIHQIYNSASFKTENSKIYCTIGNPGINKLAIPIEIKPTDIKSLLEFALSNRIELTIVGPEIPLSLGIVDEFEKNGLKIFGPSQKAAEIETSKVFSKDLMNKYGIPTAKSENFDYSNVDSAIKYAEELGYPVVVKADGLAAGKGVVIAENPRMLKNTLSDFTEKNIFGESGRSFLIEEFLKGYELSVFVITDGDDYLILPSSQDHKKIGENDTGKNTGGMGAYAPADFLTDDKLYSSFKTLIIEPTLNALRKENRKYKGCLYAGLMISEDSKGEKVPFVIEFNCRFGDPETQAVLPLIKSDFLELLFASVNGKISGYKLEIKQGYSCCVVLSSKGYPENYETGKIIKGLDDNFQNCFIFHSGTKSDGDKVLTNGGRVLSVVGINENSLKEAINTSYENIKKIDFENKYYRKDIALKGLRLLIK